MRISFQWIGDKNNLIHISDGYGNANIHIVEEMKKLGIKCLENDPTCPIRFMFTPPPAYAVYKNQYNIGYSAHESSEISSTSQKSIESVDEVWATSKFSLDVFKKYVEESATTVFPHGVSRSFKPSLRSKNFKTFTFLHVGEPSQRKGGKIAIDAFKSTFGDDDRFRLIIKANKFDFIETKLLQEKNIKVIDRQISFKQYLRLIYLANCLVFPSYGEGFGMINLEALSTGMPIISTWEWAEYKKYIINRIDSTYAPYPQNLVSSVLESELLGNVYVPSVQSVAENMINVVENYKSQLDIHYENAQTVYEEYSWENVVKNHAVPRLEKIYNSII
jgi:glycosyltransferase involved in cell wall biosynthesis